ncbi:MAG: DUF4886 domain-containing protein, partial [Bacteroidales bacterium]|nr:DUF4886 domain-containing protein [Bacteroidales bacterium]
MKKVLLLLAGLLLVLKVSAQENYPNYPLPENPDTLRILAIGNSFSDDATQYLPGLLEAAGIHNVILGRLYIGGCSLEKHCRMYKDEELQYKYMKSSSDNKWVTVKEYHQGGFLDGVKDEPWDIITMQQASPK